LRFKGSKLDVDVNMPDLQSLDKLKQRLSEEAKLNVEIVSASSRDGKVESRLSLQAAGGGQ
jgi:general secretion pathway protein L